MARIRLYFPSAEAQAVLREYKEQHYAQWLNDAIPALGGKTPREAARTQKRREQLIMLLSDLELAESELPEPERFDFQKLRYALGL